MTPAMLGLLASFSLLLASGQILFKMVARTSAPLSDIGGLFSLAFNFWFWAALTLYGCATLLWIYILQKIELVQAYPFIALGFIIVPLASFVFFGERVNMYYAGGVLLILAGLWLITVKAGLN